MKVYIVTCGSNEDYQILEVFSSKELAQVYCEKRGGYIENHADIEEWEIDKNG